MVELYHFKFFFYLGFSNEEVKQGLSFALYCKFNGRLNRVIEVAAMENVNEFQTKITHMYIQTLIVELLCIQKKMDLG